MLTKFLPYHTLIHTFLYIYTHILGLNNQKRKLCKINFSCLITIGTVGANKSDVVKDITDEIAETKGHKIGISKDCGSLTTLKFPCRIAIVDMQKLAEDALNKYGRTTNSVNNN